MAAPYKLHGVWLSGPTYKVGLMLALTQQKFDYEFINLRESTALMSIVRGSSLIEYSMAFCVTNNVTLSDPDDWVMCGRYGLRVQAMATQ